MSSARIKAFAVTTALTTVASWMGGHAYGFVHDYGRHALAGGLCLAALTAGVVLVRRA
ncbi:hypothetical protein [Methylobacterium brachiatum]